jgi:serine O-acetyltransferase
MFESIRADAKRYTSHANSHALSWALYPGFWITLTYRFGHWGKTRRFLPLKLAVYILHRIMAMPWRTNKSVYIPPECKIGPGLRMVHPQNIWIPPRSVIGAGVSIYQEVTLGTGPQPGVPTIGNDVMIFPGAKILGGIHVGDHVYIGANAVLTKDAPDYSTVSAPLSRVIPANMAQGVRDIHLEKEEQKAHTNV